MSDDYEPYDHRERKYTTTNFESLFHIIKGILGTGILALPEAFMYAGLFIGSTFVIILTILVAYTLHILFRSMYQICKILKVPQLTYPQAFKEILLVGPDWLKKFSDSAPYIVNFFIVFYQIGACCVYYIFIVSNIKQVVDQNVHKDYHFGVEFYMTLFLIPLLGITYIKNLKFLAPISNLGNWVTFFGLITIYYYVLREIEPLSDRRMFGKWQEFPLFMGTAIFASISLPVFLSVEQSMGKPQDFGGWFGMLNIGIFLVTILNLMTGFTGYWKYGDKTEASITLNLSIDEPLSWAVRILFSLAIFFSYSLQCYPVIEIFWEQYIEKYMVTSEHKLFWEYVMRTIIVLSTFLLSIAIPRLGLFISLVGAFCICMLCIVFPPIMEICLHWPDRLGKMNWILYKNIALIFFGVLGFVSGTYANVSAIVQSFIK